MHRDTHDLIVGALPRGRTVYHYFRGRFAIALLEHAIERDGAIRRLKTSRLAPLLDNPVMRPALANASRGVLSQEDLMAAWPQRPTAYRLTLGKWPHDGERFDRTWHQMARRGCNLVLQMNFSVGHNRKCRDLFQGTDFDYLVEEDESPCHPIAGGNELTLAWSRIDLDLDTGEALIEEVQSDWISDARHCNRWCRSGETADVWSNYYDSILRPHLKIWDEAMLAATIWFLTKEIGLRRIFYYTPETGTKMKRIVDSAPPKSVYSRLPRKFCFERTHNGPLFLRDASSRFVRRRFVMPETQWWRLDL